MPENLGALYIAILLLPGFVGYAVLAKLYNRKIEDSFDKAALVISIDVLSLAIIGIFHKLNIPRNDAVLSGEDVYNFVVNTFPVQSVIATIIGGLLGFVGNSECVSKFLHNAGVSSKAGYGAVIAATIRRYPNAYFRFRMKDGGYVIGHPRLYSLDGEEACILLERAAFRRKKANGGPIPSQINVDGPGIVMVNFDEVLFIELV